MSPEKKAEYLDAIQRGVSLRDAAAILGVSRRTIERWRKEDPELDEAVLSAMEAADDKVEEVAYKNCLDPDPSHNTLRMFWLKSRRPDVYRDRQDVSKSGSVTVKVEYIDADGSDDSTPETA